MAISLRLPVNKKMVAVALTLGLLFAVLFVEMAKANPWLPFKAANPIPGGTIPPVITLFSPQNNTVYASNNVHVNFNVSKPQPPMPLDSGISAVKYFLDDNATVAYFCDHYSAGSPLGIPEFSFSDNFTIANGEHMLAVYATGVVLPEDMPGYMITFGMNSNVTIFFSVNSTQSEPEPLPSSSPSSNSSLSSSQETENQSEPQPFPTTFVAASVASVAVAGVDLGVYFGKVKKGKAE